MSYVYLHERNMNPLVREQWPEQHMWLCEKLEAFKKVLAPRVKKLNASDYVADEQDGHNFVGVNPTDIEN